MCIRDRNTPYQDLPENVRHMLIHGTDGMEVLVHYKGQRGEGIYPVAFEGLIKNLSLIHIWIRMSSLPGWEEVRRISSVWKDGTSWSCSPPIARSGPL